MDCIDQNIKRIVDYLESTGELDNTFILFCSDNGAGKYPGMSACALPLLCCAVLTDVSEGALLEALPIMGDSSSVSSIINKYYDNSLDNIGRADSYVWYGPEWASAAMAPSRGFKTWITEGGIRCPCLVRYPGLVRQATVAPPGSATIDPAATAGLSTDSFATVMDILPTILDLAGVPLPGMRFRGRDVVPVRGASWVPHLAGAAASFHDEELAITGWELFGLRAIRQGRWKAVFMCAPRGKDRWELYDLRNDPGELHDLADCEPEILKRLMAHWEVYYAETGMFDPQQEFPMVKLQ